MTQNFTQSPERENGRAEVLGGIREKLGGLHNNYLELRETARQNLVPGIQQVIEAQKGISGNTLLTAGGLVIDAGEGAIMGILTGGASEWIPFTEILTDIGSTKLFESLGVEIPDNYKTLGTALGALPVVGDFISPVTITGTTGVARNFGELRNGVGQIGRGLFDLYHHFKNPNINTSPGVV
ncbi:hypothetical protein GF362_04915 [Candidatus Dojkabacteria bacterium]|nr:hypothetical protein [Candidatus Dojkabacteria bacterium]